ncbi:hypothetical protein ACWGI9_03715 [Streptomyces sp. NPDC054833]
MFADQADGPLLAERDGLAPALAAADPSRASRLGEQAVDLEAAVVEDQPALTGREFMVAGLVADGHPFSPICP